MFGEEIGWRGFGQTLLQTKIGVFKAALVIGVIWSVWHLWPLVTPGNGSTASTTVIILTVVRLVSTSLIYAWMLNWSKGSLLIAMLAHAGHNLANTIIPVSNSESEYIIVVLLYALAALAAVSFIKLKGRETFAAGH
jgi:uncharacterized protein